MYAIATSKHAFSESRGYLLHRKRISVVARKVVCFPILKDRGVLREDGNQFVSLKFVVSEKKG